MKYGLQLMVACLPLLIGCSGSGDGNWYDKLAAYDTGTDATPLLAELKQAGYPCRTSPYDPIGEMHAIYFLPRGDIHLNTRKNEAGKPLTLNKPFFVTSARSVEKRIEIWEQQSR